MTAADWLIIMLIVLTVAALLFICFADDDRGRAVTLHQLFWVLLIYHVVALIGAASAGSSLLWLSIAAVMASAVCVVCTRSASK